MTLNPRKGPSGRKVTQTAPTGGWTSGDLFAIRTGPQGLVGECIDDVAATETGAVEVGHQATIPKNTGTGESFAVGDVWYEDASTGKATPTALGNNYGGTVVAAAGTAVTTVEVLFDATGGGNANLDTEGDITLTDGGTVTQATSITTGVTLNTHSGQITTVSSTLAAAAEAEFVVTNSNVAATDTVIVNLGSTSSAGTPYALCTRVAAGSFTILVGNKHASNALDNTLTINFAVIGGASS